MNSDRLALEKIICDQLCVVDRPPADAATLADLGGDSLDVVELSLALEDEFAVTIGDEELNLESSVGDIHAMVQRKKGG